jgi:hypothetical protein
MMHINFRHKKVSEIDLKWATSVGTIYVTYTKLHALHYRQTQCKCFKNITISQAEKCGVQFRIPNSTYKLFVYLTAAHCSSLMQTPEGNLSYLKYPAWKRQNGAIIPNYHSWPKGTQWLRHCATNQKVVGSILSGVIGIFH